MKESSPHKPVMVDEVVGFLGLKKGFKVLDATVGCGGHASVILHKILPGGFLAGIDRDGKSLEIAKKRLGEISEAFGLVRANFIDIDKVLPRFGIDKIDAALFDLGISSFQLDDAGRGFSFEADGPLDMRMDGTSGFSAWDIVNRLKKKDLERIIRDFGEERYHRRITDFILEERKRNPINTTRELAEIIVKAAGAGYRSQRIHPATRTFQALRIAVNSELENLSAALDKAVRYLSGGARAAVISFHSLEDRIVKNRFKEFEKGGLGRIITKKPVTPSRGEISVNPRARSAKLRVFEARRENGRHTIF